LNLNITKNQNIY
jgi:succinate dehydrogenase (ubiquinone) iron-sulfur subunit